MTGRDFSIFQEAPWLAGGPSRLGLAANVPTMLAYEEQLLYHWLTAEWARGTGEIVELGSFVGGSTARLAEGHMAAGLSTTIHAYDRFSASEGLKQKMLYPNGVTPFYGDDILPIAQDFLAPYAPNITFHKGEIEDQSWSGDPIELLIMDASKSTASNDAMARMFFPNLTPDAVVVHQDYLHWRQPWVAVQMQLLADWFQPVAHAMAETLVFRLIKPLTTDALEAGRTDGLSDDEMIRILEDARPTYEQFGVESHLTDAIEGIRRSPGIRIAWQMTPA